MGIDMPAVIQGREHLQAILRQAPERARRALAIALYREAHEIMGVSKVTYVPIDSGVLRASGTVKPPVFSGATMVSVTFGYGGPARSYAVIQHDDLTLHHPPLNPRQRFSKSGKPRPQPRPGQAKYLQRPFDLALVGMNWRLAQSCQMMFAGAGA